EIELFTLRDPRHQRRHAAALIVSSRVEGQRTRRFLGARFARERGPIDDRGAEPVAEGAERYGRAELSAQGVQGAIAPVGAHRVGLFEQRGEACVTRGESLLLT